MKKFFTLIAAVAMAASAHADTKIIEWNISEWDEQTISETTSTDNLTIYAGKDANGKVCSFTVDKNSKTIDNVKYTKRLKYGGKGVFAEDGVTPLYRVLEFSVEAPADVYVALTTSNTTDAKELYLDVLENGATERTNVGTISLEGNELKGATLKYTGKGGKLFLYPNGGVNVYYIKVTTSTTSGINSAISEVSSDADAATYNVLGQKVASDTKGLVIKNGKKFINK